MQEQITITQVEAAHVLLEGKTRNLLAPFMRSEQTLTSAANDLDMSTSALHYHLRRFLDLRLLEPTRTESRAGRAHRYYRSTARTFVVPWHLAPADTFADFLNDSSRDMKRQFYREYAKTLQDMSSAWFIKFVSVGGGIGFTVEPTEQSLRDTADVATLIDEMPPALEYLSHFRLEYETAKALQRDLVELYGRYEEKSLSQGQGYALHLGLTPLHDPSL